ncbi:triosephosphate isomerase [Pseudoalteromonas porphyrae]|uniref:triose-phosphate isomerase n=1 Tax=Pseudoalteromonas TaxID=53246 RepID=UPI0006BB3084|nr:MULTISPECIES: triose-phosphate isomerase [Pseudoalteromonas]KPH96254.1 triosephosphate isomerase [Pseudoalteromonas porphyrae]NMR25527.1 triose-phosphate isomerase [Pseudoalteromonas sp. NEC-BIFX-2020_015]NNG42316.1 triose-phosphate isomerase [Pseudoalteromonas sp. NEC-BIFX-2020_002]
MAIRKPMVAGNWKMNGSKELVQQLSDAINNVKSDKIDVVIFPPYPLLPMLTAAGVTTGAQTVSENEAGAFTGEVDAQLIKDLGGEYTLVGHSERRNIYGESNDTVAAKFSRAQQVGLTPILCVGESEEQREQGQTELVVAAQIDAVIDKLGLAALKDSVIAYEPVWAIGTGKTASPEQAQNVHKFIRDKIADKNSDLAQGLTILYGGSVNEKNSELLFAQPDIDGGLIGGASLKAGLFTAICESAKGTV